jgi:hypothetical protein
MRAGAVAIIENLSITARAFSRSRMNSEPK